VGGHLPQGGAVNAPALLYGEPDLAIRVVRDIFNEDFGRLVISGTTPGTRSSRTSATWRPTSSTGSNAGTARRDVFAHYRIDEQIAKALDRRCGCRRAAPSSSTGPRR
jgi:ribonuclease E